MKKLIVLATILGLLLTACGQVPTPAPTAAPPPTTAPPTEPPPTAVPTTAPPPTEPPPTAVPLRTDKLEGETIVLHHFGDITGPYAAITAPLVNGLNDAVKLLNEQGGIRGARVETIFSDTGGNIEEAISVYNRYLDEDPILMFTYSSPEVEALRDRLTEDQVPMLTPGVSGKGLYAPPGWVFGFVPIYPDQFGLFLDWLVADWETVKPAGAGDKPKVAIITWDTAYGRGADTPETRAYAERLGVEIVSVEFIEQAPTADATTAILNAQAAGANVLYTNTLAFGPAAILKDAVALGLRDEFLIGGNNWAMDLSMLALAGEASEGFYGLVPYAWWNDTDIPGVKIAEEQFAANARKPAEHAVAYLISFALVDVAREAIDRAIQKGGLEALDGPAVFEQLKGMQDYQAFDGLMIVTFGEDVRSTSAARIAQVRGGQFVPVTDWMVAPDLRPSE